MNDAQDLVKGSDATPPQRASAEDAKDAVIELRDVSRHFGALHVLDGAGLSVRAGEIVALVGPSGSGKSSLLHIAGLLEKPTAGEVIIDGRDCVALPDAARTAIRRERIGFVYQFHHLLPEFDALGNVALPLMVAGVKRSVADARAAELLTRVGLGERLNHQPAQLSGGEQQRTALARALANSPGILLADEPTGNLDPATAQGVFEMLLEVVRKDGTAALIATHNEQLARRMDRVLKIEHRRVVAAGS